MFAKPIATRKMRMPFLRFIKLTILKISGRHYWINIGRIIIRRISTRNTRRVYRRMVRRIIKRIFEQVIKRIIRIVVIKNKI